MQSDFIKSNLKPRDYLIKDVCRIVNPKQQRLYIKNKVYPIDIYMSVDFENNPVMVMVFDRKDSMDVYDLWCDHKLV